MFKRGSKANGKKHKISNKNLSKKFYRKTLKIKLIFGTKNFSFTTFSTKYLCSNFTVLSDLECLNDPGLNLLGEGLCGSPLLLCLCLCSVQHLKILLCGFKYMLRYITLCSLGMVTRTWSTLYLQRQFLIYTILHCGYIV